MTGTGDPNIGLVPKIVKSKGKGKGKGKEGVRGRGKCFYRSENGHCKRNYPEYLATRVQGMIESHIIEVSVITDTLNNWCIDSGATNHIYNSLQGFRSTRKCSDGKVILTLGSSVTVSVVAIGVIVLEFQDNKTLILSDVLYVPLMRRNLISVSELSNKGYSFTFGTKMVIKRDRKSVV